MNFRNLTMMAASAVLGAICAGPVVAGNVLQTVQFPGVSAESLYKVCLSSSGHADAGPPFRVVKGARGGQGFRRLASVSCTTVPVRVGSAVSHRARRILRRQDAECAVLAS
jgi:hypothetical protein